MTLTFACGHVLTVPDTVDEKPPCPECAETRITRVKVRNPRITGVGNSPLKGT